MGGEEPARHLQDADHRRGRAEFADNRLPVPAIAVLPGDRRRRRAILVAAERARDFPQSLPLAANRGPVYLLGTGESVETPIVSQMADFTSSRAFRVAGPKAFAEVGLTHNDVDHLMIYDAFAHLPIYGLEDLGFVPRGEAGAFIAERNTASGGRLPLNNGGGLSYIHSGMYGMYALEESVRQMRGTAPAQIPGAKISVCHGVGGMFAASGTIIMSNEAP
jgi:acetyl-CoA acetyltransferase